MKKRIVTLLLGALILFGVSTKSFAYDFDSAYYARKYPDVVAAVGDSYDALYNHYITHGIYEGRYVSQEEESYYFENNLTKYVEKPTPTTVENDTAVTTPKEETKQEEFTPIEIIPVFDTYVDVDITNQVVTYFEDKVVKMQCPCVSGLANGERDTPTGTFKILTKMPGKRLIGPTWDCWVNRWMRFTEDSCGLHDASWRSSFGGEIYKTNGSHGCVNLPKDSAYELYDYVKVGTTVYVH